MIPSVHPTSWTALNHEPRASKQVSWVYSPIYGDLVGIYRGFSMGINGVK